MRAIATHRLVLGRESVELGLDIGIDGSRVFQGLQLTRLRVQAIAVDRHEFLLAQVAIDDAVGLDPLGRIRSRGGVVRRASQHEPEPGHRDRTAAAKQQHPLTLPRLGIEGADRVFGGVRRPAILGSCGGAHAPAPSVCTT